MSEATEAATRSQLRSDFLVALTKLLDRQKW